jgi:hypothetical protein
MTVRELIQELTAAEDLDMPVVMSSDVEGNQYRPLGSFDHVNYSEAESIVFDEDERSDLEEDGCDLEDSELVFCLWPAY